MILKLIKQQSIIKIIFLNSLSVINMYPDSGTERRGGTRGHVPPNTKFGGGAKWPCAPQSSEIWVNRGIIRRRRRRKKFLSLSTRYNGHFWKMCAPPIFLTRSAPAPTMTILKKYTKIILEKDKNIYCNQYNLSSRVDLERDNDKHDENKKIDDFKDTLATPNDKEKPTFNECAECYMISSRAS